MKVKGNTKRFAVSEETGRIKTKLVFSEKKKNMRAIAVERITPI